MLLLSARSLSARSSLTPRRPNSASPRRSSSVASEHFCEIVSLAVKSAIAGSWKTCFGDRIFVTHTLDGVMRNEEDDASVAFTIRILAARELEASNYGFETLVALLLPGDVNPWITRLRVVQSESGYSLENDFIRWELEIEKSLAIWRR